jgi:antitoxin component of MazEF toxin-antitoxin module
MMIQKVNRLGTSKAVIIPKDFFTYWEEKGKTFHEIVVRISENMDEITIKPIFEDIKKRETK